MRRVRIPVNPGEPPTDPAIIEAVERLNRAKDAVRAARIPYDAAVKEQDEAWLHLHRLRCPEPRTDFPLCG